MKSVLLIVISFACAVTSTAWEPLSPEETLFIITRCQEDHFRHNLTKLKLWGDFVLPRDDVDTACYVKCIISMAEQFDNDTNSFKEVVRNCSIEEGTKDPAYLTCLYAHHELQGPMWKGTDYREIRSMNYFYLLRDPPEYDPKEIRMQVCAIDAEVGCVNGKECAED
ncbi:hypothetical protein pipiens_001576 [Culex pipiens pipiens]|uniref:Uncharacterized protein n=1 Tax=Culex pipiens pipiens TaxID=38569 RepID=A0ABD1CIM3_CULPP